jgi:hypothetical protein
MSEQVSAERLIIRRLREIESLNDPAYAGFSNAARNALAEIARLERERDQYKQVAELNAETIKAMQNSHVMELVRLANSVRFSR